MNSEIFRAYDIRGTYPGQINEREVFDIALRMRVVFKNGKKIVIGRDVRNSSPALYRALYNGLGSAGFKVIDAGLMITPMIDFFVRRLRADGGIVVTASHNPKNFNGLYIIDGKGGSIGGKYIYNRIKSFNPKIKKLHLKYLKGNEEGNQRQYAEFLGKMFSIKKPMKVVIDCSNGSAGPIIKKIKFPEKVKPIFINTNPDGNFPAHGPNPMVKGALKNAISSISKNRADLGIVFDGDGDRAFILDNFGREIIPEYVWKAIDSAYPQKGIVYSVLSGYMMKELKSELSESRQLKLVESEVGHLFMRRACFREKNSIGVETSMHYYMPWDNFAGSGILAMIIAINAYSQMPYSSSEFVSMMPVIFRIPEYNIDLDRKKLPALYSKLKSVFSKKSLKISHIDGLSIFGKGWWFNVRPSNTEDLVRINIEATNKKDIDRIKNIVLSKIKK